MTRKRLKNRIKKVNKALFLYFYRKEKKIRRFLSSIRLKSRKPLIPVVERLFLVSALVFSSIPQVSFSPEVPNHHIYAELHPVNPMLTSEFMVSDESSEAEIKQKQIESSETLVTLPESPLREPRYRKEIVITFYSSDPWQTDDTPFITANGRHVQDGIAAANFLPFGTAIKIPELYGDKVLTIQDRMNERYGNRVDVWVETREEAKERGVEYTTVEIY